MGNICLSKFAFKECFIKMFVNIPILKIRNVKRYETNDVSKFTNLLNFNLNIQHKYSLSFENCMFSCYSLRPAILSILMMLFMSINSSKEIRVRLQFFNRDIILTKCLIDICYFLKFTVTLTCTKANIILYHHV